MITIDSIPLAQGYVPFFGHGLQLLKDPLGFVASQATLGKLSRVKLGPITVVIVCDPELTHEVLMDDSTFDKGGPFYDRSREVAGDGLGTCPHSRHRRQRRLCAPTFRLDRFPGYAEVMAHCIEQVVKHWHDGAEINLSAEMSKLSVRAALRTMFSMSLSEALVQQIGDDFNFIAEGLFRRTVMPPLLNRLPTRGNRQFHGAKRRLRSTGTKLVAERRADGSDRGDLLSSLLSASDPDSSAGAVKMSDEELGDQLFTFFLAGAETTASSLVWALRLLSQSPDVERQVHEEVDAVLGGRPARMEDVPNLPAVKRVITETLRMYPAGWLLTRVVAADTKLGGVSLPANTTIAVSPYVIHRREDVYERADQFVPDRWRDVRPTRATYIPFGDGARKCIGDQFALTEMALALATITGSWKLTPLTTQLAAPRLKDLPAPRCMPMRVSRRKSRTCSAVNHLA